MRSFRSYFRNIAESAAISSVFRRLRSRLGVPPVIFPTRDCSEGAVSIEAGGHLRWRPSCGQLLVACGQSRGRQVRRRGDVLSALRSVGRRLLCEGTLLRSCRRSLGHSWRRAPHEDAQSAGAAGRHADGSRASPAKTTSTATNRGARCSAIRAARLRDAAGLINNFAVCSRCCEFTKGHNFRPKSGPQSHAPCQAQSIS